MKIAISSDERTHLTDLLIEDLRRRGHTVAAFGPLAEPESDPEEDWPLVSARVAQTVACGDADEGIVCCWTGTGASIAANKVSGVRAALCHDAETARVWNHANVLALSLRATSETVAKEILDAWFATPYQRDRLSAPGFCHGGESRVARADVRATAVPSVAGFLPIRQTSWVWNSSLYA